VRKTKIFNQSAANGKIKSLTEPRGNWVAGYGFGGIPVAGYGVAGVPVADNWIAVYGGDFGKYAHVLYVFTNKRPRIVYFG
jgi:hypothetical protein